MNVVFPENTLVSNSLINDDGKGYFLGPDWLTKESKFSNLGIFTWLVPEIGKETSVWVRDHKVHS